MPGFNIHGTGALPNGPSNVYEPRRKHRWYFEVIDRNNGTIPANVLLVLKEASRPHFTFDEPEMHHNQEQAYFAGKQRWEPIKLVWYDIEQSPDVSNEIFTWLKGVVDLTGGQLPVFHPRDYKKDAKLRIIDGTGSPTETWEMYGCWPQDLNWNSLDYAVSDLLLIEVNMRYDRANKKS